MDVVMKDIVSASAAHLDELLRIITVWRQRVSNVGSKHMRTEEV